MTRNLMIAIPALLSASLALAGASAASQDAPKNDPMSACPMHEQHMREKAAGHSHVDGVNKRGDSAMGFSHAKTTHHFRIYADGGAIEVSANDAADSESREQIRAHLQAIAKAFSEGRFETPMAVHDRVPPGVPIMERRKAEITYSYEQTERGATVRIRTQNPDALDAVHDFLRFQIQDHQTGDPLDASPGR